MHESTESNLALRFRDRARRTPDRVALVVGGRTRSYGELGAAAGRVASWLRSHGESGRVGIFAHRSEITYAGILGSCLAGFTYVPIGVALPVDRQIEIVQRAGVRFLLADRAVAPRVAASASLAIVSPENEAELHRHDAAAAPAAVAPDQAAYEMFTSGTTGKPKGVLVSVGNLQHFLHVMRDRFPIHEDDRVSQFYEPNFDLSLFDLFMTLEAGASLHVVPESQTMAPGSFIRKERLTVWSSVPSVLAFMAKTRQLSPGAYPHLRAAMFCGEPLPLASVEQFRAAAPACAIDNQYGPTEATVSCTGEWIRVGTPPRVTETRGIVSIGQPFPGTHVGIVDPDGRFLPQGEKGELALSGPQVAIGYDDEELTARRFRTLAHPGLGAGRWYLTGDLAYQDRDGCFHHLGRIDNQVKIVGHRVELEEIDAHLRGASGVDALAVPWPVENGVASGVVAFLVEGGWDAASVQAAMAQRAPRYMIPRRLIAVASLPTAPNGKLDRKALRRGLEEGDFDVR